MTGISPLLAQRRHSEVFPGRALQGPDRARRVGNTVPAAEHLGTRVQPTLITHSSPMGFRGPLRCQGGLPRAHGGWVVLPRYTNPPIPTPVPYPARTPRQTTRYTPGTHRSYTRFSTAVGEPRGSRTQPVYGPRTGYIQLLVLRRFYTAV